MDVDYVWMCGVASDSFCGANDFWTHVYGCVGVSCVPGMSRLGTGFKRRFLREEGQYEMAIQEYDEAIRLERHYGEAYYKRGLAHEALGKTKEASRDLESAIQEYDETIRTNPYAYPYHHRALTYKALGMTIEAERDFESAIQKWDETIRLYPQASVYYYYRGVAHEALGKTLEAERDFAKAKELGYEP